MTLIDRLRATRDVPVVQRSICAMPRTLISVVDKVYVNPDGPEAATALQTMLEALEDIENLATYRIQDGEEMGANAWRLALVNIADDARAALAKVKG